LIFLLLVCAMLIGVLLTALTRQKVAAEALFNEAIGTL
jgi:hypothetical protein